jgi:peptidoglycan hydrolase-like protein with peptidoglycan-binding domain
MLNAENNAGLEVDGEFGVFTYSAVNKFQTAHGLERDGIVGPLTWGELKK